MVIETRFVFICNVCEFTIQVIVKSIDFEINIVELFEKIYRSLESLWNYILQGTKLKF